MDFVDEYRRRRRRKGEQGGRQDQACHNQGDCEAAHFWIHVVSLPADGTIRVVAAPSVLLPIPAGGAPLAVAAGLLGTLLLFALALRATPDVP